MTISERGASDRNKRPALVRTCNMRAAKLFLAGALLWCTGATAQEPQYNFELTPYGAYRFGGEFEDTDSDRSVELDDDSGFGVIFNIRHSYNTQWEILYSRQETTADASGFDIGDPRFDLNVEYLHGGGTYLFDGNSAQPFVSATLGVTRATVDNPGFSDDSWFSFAIGTGLRLRPTDRLGIRLEARAFGTLLDSESDIFCRTGPDENLCAIRVDGTVMWQLETFAGLVFRF